MIWLFLLFASICIAILIVIWRRSGDDYNPPRQTPRGETNTNYTARVLREEAAKLDFEVNSAEKTKSDFYKTTSFIENTWGEKYPYQKHQISEIEVVYAFGEDVFLFVGAMLNAYRNDHRGTFIRHILVEELTYNHLFKLSATKLGENLSNSFYDIDVVFFYSYKGKLMQKESNSTFLFYADSKLPQLKIAKKAEMWPGILVNFVVLELYDKDKVVATVRYTEVKDWEKFANRCCGEFERMRVNKEPHNKINHIDFIDKIREIRLNFTQEKSQSTWTLRGHLRYFCVSEFVPDYDCQSRGLQILDALKLGMYKDVERLEYGRFDGKWKSELRVYEIAQKLYGKENVLFQYSPEFLGQMSYDVFIIPYNVAIEYQGKQHYEPVDFFGGEEHFKKQVARDKTKRDLSRKHKIKLVYITYKEVVDESTIKEKVERANKKQ